MLYCYIVFLIVVCKASQQEDILPISNIFCASTFGIVFTVLNEPAVLNLNHATLKYSLCIPCLLRFYMNLLTSSCLNELYFVIKKLFSIVSILNVNIMEINMTFHYISIHLKLFFASKHHVM